MENPYEQCPDTCEHITDLGGCGGDRHDAWNEGDANGDERGYARGKADRYEQIKRQRAELDRQKQIVSELVETLEVIALQMKVWSSGWPLSDLLQWIDESRANLNTTIAKATGI